MERQSFFLFFFFLSFFSRHGNPGQAIYDIWHNNPFRKSMVSMGIRCCILWHVEFQLDLDGTHDGTLKTGVTTSSINEEIKTECNKMVIFEIVNH